MTKIIERTCPECGKIFRLAHRKYCSPECSRKHAQKQNAVYHENYRKTHAEQIKRYNDTHKELAKIRMARYQEKHKNDKMKGTIV
jgi:septal ring factor EnvC (AmiA/AmiB activator)